MSLAYYLRQFFCTHQEDMRAVDKYKQRIYTICSRCGRETVGVIIGTSDAH